MSMLLDALRKSEEQRRLGAQPDIHQPPGDRVGQDAGPLRQWVPVALIVVAAMVMAWFGWQQFSPPPDIVTEPRVSVPSPPTEPPAAPPRQQPAPSAQAPAEGPRTPVEAYTAPPTVAVDRPAPSTESTPSLKDISEFKAPPGETPPPGTAASGPAKPVPAPSPQRGAEPAGDAPYQPDAMSYWELPQSVRDGLPQFRISVIVYADDPADRFVLVNGVRLRESDELQSGVVLEEIRREGAIFRARNYRFLVKG